MRGRRQEMAARSPAGVEPGRTTGGSRQDASSCSSFLPRFIVVTLPPLFLHSDSFLFSHLDEQTVFSQTCTFCSDLYARHSRCERALSGSRSRVVFPPLFSAESRYVTAPRAHQLSFRTDPIQDVQRRLHITVLLKG